MWRRARTAVSPSPPRKRGLPLSVSEPKPNPRSSVGFSGLRMLLTMKAWARKAPKVCFLERCVFVLCLDVVSLSTDTRQQYAASTTNHARPANHLTKTRPHLPPPTPIASPTLAEPSLRIVVATSTKTQTVHAIMIMPILLIRMPLERVSKRLASLALMPMKECPEERHPRRTEP